MSSENHIVSIKIYVVVFMTLMIGTALTVWAAFQDFGPMNTVIAVSIAIIKASLVVLYFMHVRFSSRLTWVVVGGGFLWLVVLFALTLSDYYSRGWLRTYTP